jgi:uracil-DNA glycosylase family 4
VLKYSQESDKRINPAKSKSCKACGLYLNQLPALDKTKTSSVFWVGLSAVQFSEDDERVPLSPFTRSGALIADIEKSFTKTVSFYRTNLVKCLPLSKDKIRYPVKSEMERCYANFEDEIEAMKPKLIFLLGKQVANFIYDKIGAGTVELSDDFEFGSFSVNGITYVPVHHPSFILVYKRKFVAEYTKGIHSHIKKSLSKKTPKGRLTAASKFARVS